MITFVSAAKPFRGHDDVIQRNPLKSWKLCHRDHSNLATMKVRQKSASRFRHEPHDDRHESDVTRLVIELHGFLI
jgi:hypothetical protein